MAKLLLAVMTCHMLDYFISENSIDYNTCKGWRCLDQQARVNTIRETWLRNWPNDYKFFYGKTLRHPNQGRNRPITQLRKPLSDEVFLDCGDNYIQNPQKMKAICQYAIDNGYDFLLRTDDDTYVVPSRLLSSDWREYDYSGSSAVDFHPGGCLFLSRRAMQIILDAPIKGWADDVWIGEVMKRAGIHMHQIPTMHNKWGEGYKVKPEALAPTFSSAHSCTPEIMRELWITGGPINYTVIYQAPS